MPEKSNQRNGVVRDEIRCHCYHKPLIGICGVDEFGRGFVHIRIYKRDRVFGEVVSTGGVTKIRCRECYRWTRIHLRTQTVEHDAPEPRVVAKGPTRPGG